MRLDASSVAERAIGRYYHGEYVDVDHPEIVTGTLIVHDVLVVDFSTAILTSNVMMIPIFLDGRILSSKEV
jgi:hypothetical protein